MAPPPPLSPSAAKLMSRPTRPHVVLGLISLMLFATLFLMSLSFSSRSTTTTTTTTMTSSTLPTIPTTTEHQGLQTPDDDNNDAHRDTPNFPSERAADRASSRFAQRMLKDIVTLETIENADAEAELTVDDDVSAPASQSHVTPYSRERTLVYVHDTRLPHSVRAPHRIHHSTRMFDPPSRPAHNFTEYPLYALAYLITFDDMRCRILGFQWRRYITLYPNRPYDFLIAYEEPIDATTITSNPNCARLLERSQQPRTFRDGMPVGNIRFVPLPDLQAQIRSQSSWLKIRSPHWSRAAAKIGLFLHDEYERIFALDLDTVLVQHVDSFFEIDAHFAAAPDGWDDHCRRHDVANAGVMSFRPSQFLHRVFHQYFEAPEEPKCFGGDMHYSEQGVLECVCGFAGQQRQRYTVECSLLPPFTMFTVHRAMCDNVLDKDAVTLHWAAGGLPWDPPGAWPIFQKCLDAGIRTARPSTPRSWFEEEVRRECYINQASMYAYWMCLWEDEALVDLDRPTPDCPYVRIHQPK